jgi:hypothetical protein
MSHEVRAESSARIKGRTRFTIRDAKTGEIIRQTGWIPNLVTTAGKVLFSELMRGGSSSYITYCASR